MARRTATGPNGEKLELKDGQWVPMTSPSALPSAPTSGAAAADSSIRQGLRTAGGTFVANMLSIPHATGELLAAGGALPALMPGGKTYSEARAEGEKQLPASALLAFPDPTAEDVLALPGAFARSVSNVNANRNRALSGNWSEPIKPPQLGATFAESLAAERQKSEESPIATSAGRVGGDVATMLTLKPGERIANSLNLGPFNPRAAIPEGGRLATGARTIARGLGRAAEAGLEGAALSAMGDGDPARTAAYSAGLQAAGSAALTAKGWAWNNPKSALFSIWLGHEIWKAVMPGPQETFESKDQAIRELVSAYGAGIAAAMLGAGRGVGEGGVRRVTDAISTAERATVASVITQLQEASKDGNDIPARVLEMMGKNPDSFGADVRQRLEQAAASDKPRALLNEIDSLMQSESFRNAVEGIQEVPNQAPSFGNFLMQRTGGRF